MTDEQANYIRLHYNRTLTSLQIARTLGITRNAVMGKAYRMGLGATDLNPHDRSDAINERFKRKTQAIMNARVQA